MAAGDAKCEVSGSIPAVTGNTWDIRPLEGTEICVHNIFTNQNCSLSFVSGSTVIPFDSMTATGGWIGQTFFLTNAYYLRLTNTHATDAALFGYTGVQTK